MREEAVDQSSNVEDRRILRTLRLMLKVDWILLVAVIWMTLVLLAALVGDWIAPYDHAQQDIMVRNSPPGSPDRDGGTHLLGTDLLGRDLLSRIIAGARVSLVVGMLSVGTAAFAGTVLGTLAGYARGRTEAIVMRVADIQMAIPFLLLALVFLFLFGRSLFNVVGILALLRWPVFARTARSLALSLRTTEFVEAAGMLGYSHARILGKHIWPNMASPLIVLATLEMARLIIAEATLSFLGMGVQPPHTSWGRMIAQGRDSISSASWNVVYPGLAILFTAGSTNMLANWLREITDPLRKRSR